MKSFNSVEMGNEPKKDVAARFDILGRMCTMLFIQFCLKKIENILRSNNLSFIRRGLRKLIYKFSKINR